MTHLTLAVRPPPPARAAQDQGVRHHGHRPAHPLPLRHTLEEVSARGTGLSRCGVRRESYSRYSFPNTPAASGQFFAQLIHPTPSLGTRHPSLPCHPSNHSTYGPCFEESSGRTVQSACLSFNHGGQVVLQFRRRAPEDGGTCQSSSCHDVHVRLQRAARPREACAHRGTRAKKSEVLGGGRALPPGHAYDVLREGRDALAPRAEAAWLTGVGVRRPRGRSGGRAGGRPSTLLPSPPLSFPLWGKSTHARVYAAGPRIEYLKKSLRKFSPRAEKLS